MSACLSMIPVQDIKTSSSLPSCQHGRTRFEARYWLLSSHLQKHLLHHYANTSSGSGIEDASVSSSCATGKLMLASCPQAAAASRPRVSRSVQETLAACNSANIEGHRPASMCIAMPVMITPCQTKIKSRIWALPGCTIAGH